jgi:hypothetical protein
MQLKIKSIAKNIIEKYRRLLNKNNIFKINFNEKEIIFYLPYRRDRIQQQIIIKKDFYEKELLVKSLKYLKDKKTFLDIGANIGNHSLFFSKVLGMNGYAFEPQKDVFDILEENIKLNLERVKLFNLGLGIKNENNKSIEFTDKNNCGSGKISDKEGNIEIDILSRPKGRRFPLVLWRDELLNKP